MLLFPHKAVKEFLANEYINGRDDENDQLFVRMLKDHIILFKHRVFHALGAPHKYLAESIMNEHGKPWQSDMIFYLLSEDEIALNQCYSSEGKSLRFVHAYDPNNPALDQGVFRAFMNNDFNVFKKQFE